MPHLNEKLGPSLEGVRAEVNVDTVIPDCVPWALEAKIEVEADAITKRVAMLA